MKRHLLIGTLAALATLFSVHADTVDIEGTLATFSLKQKIGQMHMIGYIGTELTPEMQTLIDDWGFGGFFYQMPDNYSTPLECAQLCNALQKAALESPVGVPLLIAMDQEGGVGVVIRYEQGAVPTVGNMALGASGREEDAYTAYHALGTDMRACGVNVTFAPAIDVLKQPKNPDYTVRSFGGDIRRNAVMARGAVRGMQDAGAIACAKHWPGLVYYEGDTHFTAPHVTEPRSVLEEGNLAHFRAAIDAGTDMIMTHMTYYDAWDPNEIVSLSPILINQMLRTDLGYDRMIVTDSMSMGSVTHLYDIGEGTVRSIVAGCDIVLQVSRDLDDLYTRMNAVLAAVESGRIAEARLDESIRRILRAKAKYSLFSNPYADIAHFGENFGRADLVEANKKVAVNGVVIVRDDAGLLPLSKSAGNVVVISPPDTIVRAGKPEGWDVPIGGTLGPFVQEYVPAAVEIQVNTVPTEAEIVSILDAAASADLIINYSLLTLFSPSQADLINRLMELGKPTVIIGLGDPSDMVMFPGVATYVAANSPAPISMEAAVKVIFGEAKAGGTLPMPIGTLYPIGYALH